MQEIYDFLKRCQTYYLATVEGDQHHSYFRRPSLHPNRQIQIRFPPAGPKSPTGDLRL